jgi:type II secretory pathway component GspD/PulD (secretin)
MKTRYIPALISAALTAVCLAAAADDATNTPPTNAPAAVDAAANAPAPAEAPPSDAAPMAPAPEQPPYMLPVTSPAPSNGLVLNFHDVPLTAVLNYLSAKAGLFIVSDVNLQGKVSVVALQPVTTNDIVSLLNDQLGKNNYSAVLQGRTLTIMDADRAKTYALTPVKVATNYSAIPIDDEIVTEIMPLHTLNAQQLVKDLDSILPRNATVTANEAGNSILMTAQQKDVRRIAEIINDLDGTALSEVTVTVLNYADAKSVAAELKEVFQSDDANVTRASTRNNFAARGGGGGRGGFGGMAAMFGGGGGGGGGGSSQDASKNVQTHAVFVSDDQLNAVVASAPPDYMHMITNVIALLDKPSQDVTALRVFILKHADPGEISDELTSLFPSTTSDQNSRTPGVQFQNPFMRMMQQRPNTGDNLSQRMKRETTVTVVPDRRIQAVIVSASRDMMDEIEGVIKDLDTGSQGVQKVTAMDFGGADPATVELTMEGLFSSPNSPKGNSTTSQTPLASRSQGNGNSQTTATQNQSSSTGGGMGGGLR